MSGYGSQQPGYPGQPAYPPPQAGYPQAPPPAYGQPPGYEYKGGYAPPQGTGFGNPGYGQQQMASTNVVVVGQQQPQTVLVERQGVNHALHCIISFFFWPWVIVWIVLCITEGS